MVEAQLLHCKEAHNDSITGNAAADNLRGYLGNDTIEGGGGADSIMVERYRLYMTLEMVLI